MLSYENKESLLAQWEWEFELMREVLGYAALYCNEEFRGKVLDEVGILEKKIKYARINLGIPVQI